MAATKRIGFVCCSNSVLLLAFFLLASSLLDALLNHLLAVVGLSNFFLTDKNKSEIRPTKKKKQIQCPCFLPLHSFHSNKKKKKKINFLEFCPPLSLSPLHIIIRHHDPLVAYPTNPDLAETKLTVLPTFEDLKEKKKVGMLRLQPASVSQPTEPSNARFHSLVLPPLHRWQHCAVRFLDSACHLTVAFGTKFSHRSTDGSTTRPVLNSRRIEN